MKNTRNRNGSRKLTLARQTLRMISQSGLAGVAGGATALGCETNNSCQTACTVCYSTCPNDC